MQRIQKLLVITTLIGIFTLPSMAQSKATDQKKHRTVTVTLTDGSMINAALVALDADYLSVQSALGESKIEIEKIQKIEFQRAASPQVESPNEIQAAIKSIRELSTAASGLSFLEYRTRVADTRAKAEEATRKLPDGELKQHLDKAIAQHLFAVLMWEISLKAKGLTADQYKKVTEAWAEAKREADAAEQLLQAK